MVKWMVSAEANPASKQRTIVVIVHSVAILKVRMVLDIPLGRCRMQPVAASLPATAPPRPGSAREPPPGGAWVIDVSETIQTTP